MRKTVTQALGFLTRDDKGATLIEYALLIALVAIVVASSVGALGIAIEELYNTVQSPFA